MPLADDAIFEKMPLVDDAIFEKMPLADDAIFEKMPLADDAIFEKMPLADVHKLDIPVDICVKNPDIVPPRFENKFGIDVTKEDTPENNPVNIGPIVAIALPRPRNPVFTNTIPPKIAPSTV